MLFVMTKIIEKIKYFEFIIDIKSSENCVFLIELEEISEK